MTFSPILAGYWDNTGCRGSRCPAVRRRRGAAARSVDRVFPWPAPSNLHATRGPAPRTMCSFSPPRTVAPFTIGTSVPTPGSPMRFDLLFGILRSRFWLVASIVAITTLMAITGSLLMSKRYSAATTVYVDANTRRLPLNCAPSRLRNTPSALPLRSRSTRPRSRLPRTS